MLWEVFVLFLKTLDSLNGKFNNKQSELDIVKEKINKLEEENIKLKNQLSENSKTSQKFDNSLEALEKRVTSLSTQINSNGKESEQKINNRNIDDRIKNSLTPFLSLIGTTEPTPLSFLKAKYPFLNGRINAKIRDRWLIRVGNDPKNRNILLIEGEEKVCFKNAETGETSEYYNIFYAGELDGNPLVALRCCSDNMFWCLKSKYDDTDVIKKNIESFNDLWTLKRIG